LGVTGFLDCWGADNRGQIGDGNDDGRSDQVTPIAVRAGADYAMVSAGEWHTCGVKAGQVYCWGGNNNFQTGIPGAARYDVPTDVMLGGISVAAGYTHTCAIASLGAMRCWGQNAEGQLGDGTRTARTMPTATAVVTTNDWAAVSAGTQHTCAIHTDGSLWCWGSNASGQLGLGEIDASTVAVEVGGLAGTMIQIVEAGAEHTCVLDAARTLYCFGSNARGQLGRDESGGSVTTPEPLCFE
jgi:alpha-tubulin suppressor-like RCC1 family protein